MKLKVPLRFPYICHFFKILLIHSLDFTETYVVLFMSVHARKKQFSFLVFYFLGNAVEYLFRSKLRHSYKIGYVSNGVGEKN